jgi:hypothetical protein
MERDVHVNGVKGPVTKGHVCHVIRVDWVKVQESNLWSLVVGWQKTAMKYKVAAGLEDVQFTANGCKTSLVHITGRCVTGST